MSASKPTEIKVMNGNGTNSCIDIRIDAETIEIKYTDAWKSEKVDPAKELNKLQGLTIKQAEKNKTQDNKKEQN